ncbi:hypothetical protein ABIC21_002071 [Pseudarthrobacter sp. PvP090]
MYPFRASVLRKSILPAERIDATGSHQKTA